MPMGAGKYDAECELVRTSANAALVIVIVGGGDRGHGFSVSCDMRRVNAEKIMHGTPAVLREIAQTIEDDLKGDTHGQS